MGMVSSTRKDDTSLMNVRMKLWGIQNYPRKSQVDTVE